MRQKLSFLSGLAAVALFVLPFATNTYAAETNSLEPTVAEAVYAVPSDVYGGGVPVEVYGPVTDEVYGPVTDEVYGPVTDEVYGPVTDEVYGPVTDEVYGPVTDEVYGPVTDEVYGPVTDEVYGPVTDDVYGPVTDDVYVDYQQLLPQSDTNEIVIDYTNVSQENNEINFFISPEDYEQMKEKNVVISKENLHVELPLKNVKAGEFTLSITKDSTSYEESVSAAYHFTLEQNGESVDFSDNPITLTFKVLNVKDPKNLKVFYIGANGKTTEEAKIISIDGDIVTAEVTHFSGYGVFEVTPTSTSTSTDGNNNNGGTTVNTNNGGTTGNTNGNTNTNTTGTGTQTSTTNGSTTTTTTTTTTTSTSAATGNALPDTATNNFNLLLAGLMLLAAGGALVIRNRKLAKTN